MKTLIYCLFAIFLVSCSCCKKEATEETQSFKKIAIKKLGKEFKTAENQAKDKILAYTKKEDNSTNDRIIKLHCVVFDKKTNKIIFEKTYDNSSIEWVDDFRLKLTITPGILTTDEKLNEELRVRYIDLRSN